MIEDIISDPIINQLKERAKSYIGRWIEDKTDPDCLLFPYDLLVVDKDVILMCYDIPAGTIRNPATIEDTDIYMSEFSEFYRLSKRSGKKAWANIRAFYDKMFTGKD